MNPSSKASRIAEWIGYCRSTVRFSLPYSISSGKESLRDRPSQYPRCQYEVRPHFSRTLRLCRRSRHCAFVATHVRPRPPRSTVFSSSDNFNLSWRPWKIKLDRDDSIFFRTELGSGKTWDTYHSLLCAKTWATTTRCCMVDRERLSQAKRVRWKPRNTIAHVELSVSEY